MRGFFFAFFFVGSFVGKVIAGHRGLIGLGFSSPVRISDILPLRRGSLGFLSLRHEGFTQPPAKLIWLENHHIYNLWDIEVHIFKMDLFSHCYFSGVFKISLEGPWTKAIGILEIQSTLRPWTSWRFSCCLPSLAAPGFSPTFLHRCRLHSELSSRYSLSCRSSIYHEDAGLCVKRVSAGGLVEKNNSSQKSIECNHFQTGRKMLLVQHFFFMIFLICSSPKKTLRIHPIGQIHGAFSPQ